MKPRRRFRLLLAGALLAASSPPGYAEDLPLRLEAESITGEEGVTRAQGNVKAYFQDYQLCAGEIEYDRSTGLIRAMGDVRLTRAGGEITAAAAEYNLQDDAGRLAHYRSALADSGLHVDGDDAEWRGSAFTARNARISSCPQDESRRQDWRLHAGTVDMTMDNQHFIIRDTTLEVAGVPVMYVPYGRFYYGSERHSGFLWPDLFAGSNSGAGLNLPYYFNLADNYDLTITPNYHSRHGLELGGDFRFLTRDSRGDVQIAAALWDEEGRGREAIRYERADGPWRFALEAENVSDNAYLRDYVGGDRKSARTLPRRAEAAYEKDGVYARAAVEHFQTLDDALTAPHRAVPQIEIGAAGGSGYDWETSLQYANFQHNTAAAGARGVWRGDVRGYTSAAGIALSPAAGLRAVAYRGDSGASFMTPYARLDAEKSYTHLFENSGERHDHLLLRAALVVAPAQKRQNAAPLYDTEAREQTSDNLYEWNRYVGDDRAADAKFFAYGGSYRLFSGARQALFVGLGQRYHLRAARITLPGENAPPQGFGNILINSRLQLGQTWRAAAAAEYDAQEKTIARFYSEVRGRFAENRLLRLRYLADEDESVILGGSAPLGAGLEAAFQTHYLMDEDHFSRSDLAMRLHDACNCWRLSFTISDSVVGESDNETEYSLGVELTGLGRIGSDYESLLNTLR